jgi:hypothetical protein
MGMPAILGSIGLNITKTPSSEVWAWSWQAQGSSPSSLTFFDNLPRANVSLSAPWRFFWFTENRANYYDLELKETYNQAGNPVIIGTMAPPMFYAQGGVAEFAGSADLDVSASFSGSIHRFSDLECKSELPPS